VSCSVVHILSGRISSHPVRQQPLFTNMVTNFDDLLTVHFSIVLVINQLKFLFYNKFIIHLYMFRTLLCSSSGGQNCIIQHLVSHTCRWPSGAQVLSQTYYKTRNCALSWLITKIMVTNILSPNDYSSVLFLSLTYIYMCCSDVSVFKQMAVCNVHISI